MKTNRPSSSPPPTTPEQPNLISANYADLIRSQLNAESTLYIIVGSDSGLFPAQLNNFTTPDGTRYLFIELDTEYKQAVAEFKKAETNKSYIANESSWKKSILDLKVENYIHSDRVTLLKSFNSFVTHQEEYEKLLTDVNNTLTTLVRGIKTQNEQLIYLEKRLENLVDLIQPAQLLAGMGKGTALILAAGPSLDELMPWIKEHRHKVTLIAVSRLYYQLSTEGIEPDIIVSVDPQKVNFQQSKAMLASRSNYLIHSCYISPQLLSQWSGTSLYMDDLFPWKHKSNVKNIKVADPTVTHAAIQLAIEMNYEQILLAGVDLCYPSTGHTHAGFQTINERDIYHSMVETYKEEMAETSFFMQMGINSLEEIVKKYQGSILNLSDNAAKVDGIDLDRFPILPQKATALPKINHITPDQRLKHLRTLQKELVNARVQFNEIQKLCKEAIKLNQAPTEITDETRYQSRQIKIDKIEHKLSTKYQDHTPLVQEMVSEELLLLLKQTDRTEKSIEENYMWLNDYYNAHIKGTELVLKTIDNAQKNLSQRLEEFSKKPKVDKLITYWRKSEPIIGRSCLLLERLPKPDDDTSKDINKLNELCEYFQESITFDPKTEKLLEKLATSHIDQLTGLHTELKDILATFTTTPTDNDTKTLYRLFLEAVIDHIENDLDSALKKYSKLTDYFDSESDHFTQFVIYGLVTTLIRRALEININEGLDIALEIQNFSDSLAINGYKNQLIKRVIHKRLTTDIATILKLDLPLHCHRLFNNGDDLSLIEIYEKLNQLYPENDQLAWSKILILGMAEHSKGQLKEAELLYTNILEGLLPDGITGNNDLKDPELEIALLQMLPLNEITGQIQIFEILSTISSSYLPKLADVLSEAGNTPQAVTILQQHLISSPDDKACLAALADLYAFDKNSDMEKLIRERIEIISEDG